MSWVLDEEVLAVLTAIIIVMTAFAIIQTIYSGRIVEPFSALGLLNENSKIGDYPNQVIAGVPFKLNVFIQNEEGKTMYYKILVKTGNKTSIINSTIPLNAEPILEIRTVLPNNASQIIPVNITLYQQATNLRLVFEMWILNETTQTFTYYGRWNQLWLNVTMPPTGIQQTNQTLTTISPSIDSKLTQAYLAIRRAENAGGNVTGMIQLMNQAIYYAEKQNNTEAQNLINQILSLEPQVIEQGQSMQTARLYTTVVIIITVSIAIIATYLFLRRRIWLYWAKIHKNWKVKWIAENNTKLERIEKIIKDLIRNNKITTLDNVLSTNIGFRKHEIAKALFMMTRKKIIELIDPNPPKSFFNYMSSKHSIGFMIAVSILILSIITIYTSQYSLVITAMRYMLGTLFVLFLPGYALVETLYPKQEDLKPLERLALSIGLSLALVPLVGLILNYTPWGIRLDPIVIALTTLTLPLLIASAYRKYDDLKLRSIIKSV